MLGTVTRAGRLLDLFTLDCPEWGPTAAARELDIAKSQAHELLTSLAMIGLLQRGRGGQFRLGWRTFALSRDLMRTEFPDAVFAVVAELAQAFREPVSLAVLERHEIVVIARRGTERLLSGGALRTQALGRVLLADLSPWQLSNTLLEPPPSDAASAWADLERVDAELAQIRVERIAFDLGAVSAVAVPIRNARGDTIAALGLWTIAERWARAHPELTRGVTGAGHRIEALLRAASPDHTGPQAVKPIADQRTL